MTLRPLLLTALLALALPVAAQAPPSPPPVDARTVVGEPRGPALQGAELDRKAAEVAALLRCPVCQGLSVGDSPAPMAVNMRRQVRDLLAQGYDVEQALAYFEASYGEFVRLKPEMRGINWLVWLAPAAALGLGGLVVARALRRRPVPAPPPPAADPDALPDDPRLARAVLLVREMAYGWPGGRRETSP